MDCANPEHLAGVQWRRDRCDHGPGLDGQFGGPPADAEIPDRPDAYRHAQTAEAAYVIAAGGGYELLQYASLWVKEGGKCAFAAGAKSIIL